MKYDLSSFAYFPKLPGPPRAEIEASMCRECTPPMDLSVITDIKCQRIRELDTFCNWVHEGTFVDATGRGRYFRIIGPRWQSITPELIKQIHETGVAV